MNNRPTPETDAAASPHIGFYSCATVTANFARRLEIERDKARTELEMWRDGNIMHQIHRDELEKTERERDEAREVLERIARASMSVRHKEEDYVEWEKAVESLLGICEENNFTNE